MQFKQTLLLCKLMSISVIVFAHLEKKKLLTISSVGFNILQISAGFLLINLKNNVFFTKLAISAFNKFFEDTVLATAHNQLQLGQFDYS